MAAGEQAEVDGRMVDRPLFAATTPTRRHPTRAGHGPGRPTHPSTSGPGRRLPRFRLYEPPARRPTIGPPSASLAAADVDAVGLEARPEVGDVGEGAGDRPSYGSAAALPRRRAAPASEGIPLYPAPVDGWLGLAGDDAHIDLAGIERGAPLAAAVTLPAPAPSVPTGSPTARSTVALPPAVEAAPAPSRLAVPTLVRVPVRISPTRWRRWRLKARRRLEAPTTTAPLDRASRVLAAVTAVAIVVAVMAVAVQDQVRSTDRFVAAMAPLHADPRVAGPIADRIAGALVDDLDLPPSRRSELRDRIETMIRDDDFAPSWELALAEAHTARVEVVGPDGAVTRPIGEVLPGLPLVLEEQGLQHHVRIEGRRVSVLQGDFVTQVQRSLRWADRSSTWLPILAAALLVVSLVRAPNRFRWLSHLGLGTAVAGTATALGSTAVAGLVVRVLASPSMRPSTTAAAGPLLGPVRGWLVALVVAGLLLALVARTEEARTAPPFVVVHDDYAVRLPGQRTHTRRRSRHHALARRVRRVASSL